MEILKDTELSEEQKVVDIINEFGFGLLASPTLNASHLPFIYEGEIGGKKYLYGHLSKNNRLSKQLEGQNVLVVFSGPHSYISPTWYKHKPAVPTWDYVSVHCVGIAEIVDDTSTLEILDKLIKKYLITTQPPLALAI